jgi:hypothetical protein
MRSFDLLNPIYQEPSVLPIVLRASDDVSDGRE